MLNDYLIKNLDAAYHTLSSRASCQIYSESFPCPSFLALWNLQMVIDPNSSDFQHAIDILYMVLNFMTTSESQLI